MKTSETKTLVGTIDADVLQFTAGRDAALDRQLVEVDCIGSAAHAVMLTTAPAEQPVLTVEEGTQLIRELTEMIRQSRLGKVTISTRDQDVHLAVERRLTRALGDLGKRIHTARSRNDQIALDLRLFGRQQLQLLRAETLELIGALLAMAGRYAKWPLVGRTHLQPAMPSSVGLWASAFAEDLLDDLLCTDAAYAYINRCPLGSAAGYGVSLAIDRELTSRLLGFEAPCVNVLHAANTRGKVESIVLHACTQLMLTLSRLSEDLILFTMPEFGYFVLPDALCTGSSIMPQKKNPDVLELIRARSAVMAGRLQTVLGIVQGLPSGYSRDLQETKEPYLEGLAQTRAAVRILGAMIPAVQPQRRQLEAGFRPEVYATDRALELVATGVAFRDAYQTVKAELVTLEIQDAASALRARTHLGGTANLGLQRLRQRQKSMQQKNQVEIQRMHRAFASLLGVSYPDLV